MRVIDFNWPYKPSLFNSVQMCKIPHLGQRLDLLLAIRELPVSMGDLEPVSNDSFIIH